MIPSFELANDSGNEFELKSAAFAHKIRRLGAELVLRVEDNGVTRSFSCV